MALKKQKTWHGVTVEYWAVTETVWTKSFNHTTVTLSAYVNAAVRSEDPSNYIPNLDICYTIPGHLSLQDIYEEIKKSKVIEVIIELTEDGNEIYGETETNWFIDAIDC